MADSTPAKDRPGRRVRRWLPTVIWALVIFALSAQPDLRFAPDQGADFVIRKVGHMAVFGILAVLLWLSWRKFPRSPRRPGSLSLAIAYAMTDELHQAAVSGRHASIVDVGFDATGALLALAAVGVALSRRR